MIGRRGAVRRHPGTMRHARRRAALAVLALVVLSGAVACSRGGGDATTRDAARSTSRPVAPTATPVRVDTVRIASLEVAVTAPGRTEALHQDRVRAPFESRLVSLPVTDGDRVARGQVMAVVVSKNSEAALAGAEQMLATARTAVDSADAQRAVAIAQRNLVRQPLHAPTAGVVMSHGAEEGDYVSDGEVLVTIAEAGAVYFNAQVTQTDLSTVRAGERATIAMPAAGAALVGAVVHGILPTASSQTLSAPVRLDFSPARPDLSVGLFGTARIVVGRRPNAVIVPAAAVLRDDVSGVTRVALDSAGRAHWVEVQTGVREGDHVEIVSPRLAPGQVVITDGQVGLPEGAPVQVGS